MSTRAPSRTGCGSTAPCRRPLRAATHAIQPEIDALHQCRQRLRLRARPTSWPQTTVTSPELHGAGDRTIALLDCGNKRSVIEEMVRRGARVVVLPAYTSAADIMSLHADGVVISNGPGNPAAAARIVHTVGELYGQMPLFGICLGHQLLALAAGGRTYKLQVWAPRRQPSGAGRRHRARLRHHPEPRLRGRSRFAAGRPLVSHRNLNDGTVEGLRHRELPVRSVQFHPEGARARRDSGIVAGSLDGGARSVTLSSVLILGSGPIVIGQAAEFDYSGTQACLACREAGIRTVLVNSNPATIQTDPHVADTVYIEPLTPEMRGAHHRPGAPGRRHRHRRRPDGAQPRPSRWRSGRRSSAMAPGSWGPASRRSGEARTVPSSRRRCAMAGQPILPSAAVTTIDEALSAAERIGYPVMCRSAFALGGAGSGFAQNSDELVRQVRSGLSFSGSGQVLVEKSVYGWSEVEYEVVRDGADNCITVCNMENIDPMGVHTGDSIVVAPSQTLSDERVSPSAACRHQGGAAAGRGGRLQRAVRPRSIAAASTS